MTNLERLALETKGINLTEEESSVYLLEAGLEPHQEYNPSSASNKRNIYIATLSILESIANQPSTMKHYKQDDISVSQFAENIQARIDQLERKIRQMKTDEQTDSNFFILFRE